MSQDIVKASDGLPALAIKPHSLDKLHFLRRYIYQFSTALRPTGNPRFPGFEKLNYIDLFCGPGLCVVEGTSEEVNGTPLIAMTTDYPFRKNFFVDLNKNFTEALRKRIGNLALESQATTIQLAGDCNDKISDILENIDKNYSANLAIVDSFGIECNWQTIEALASCRRMDMIIMFPQGMNINRNLRIWVESEDAPLDDFFGTTEWRQIYEDAHGQAKKCIRPFLDLYQGNLKRLGYNADEAVREVLIRSHGGQKLYYLIAASRNPLGAKFWKTATDKDPGGQLRLFD